MRVNNGPIIGNYETKVESILDDIIKKYRKDLILDEKLLLPLMNFKKNLKLPCGANYNVPL